MRDVLPPFFDETLTPGLSYGFVFSEIFFNEIDIFDTADHKTDPIFFV
jgi:hypothetical protein